MEPHSLFSSLWTITLLSLISFNFISSSPHISSSSSPSLEQEEPVLNSTLYDVYNISHCLAMIQINENDTSGNEMLGYEIIGISSCLQTALNQISKLNKTEKRAGDSEEIDKINRNNDMETAENIWPMFGPGYGYPGWTGGYYPRVWTDPQFNYGVNYDNAPRDPDLHPFNSDNPGFPNVLRTLRQNGGI